MYGVVHTEIFSEFNPALEPLFNNKTMENAEIVARKMSASRVPSVAAPGG